MSSLKTVTSCGIAINGHDGIVSTVVNENFPTIDRILASELPPLEYNMFQLGKVRTSSTRQHMASDMYQISMVAVCGG